jgi:RNA polymerase sigma-70 factor, ECF subfamily
VRESQEEAIRSQLAAGHSGRAIELTIRLYGAEIAAYLRASVGNGADAEDAFGIWEEMLVTALPRFEARASLRTYVYRLAHRACVRIYEQRKAHRAEPLSTGQLSEVARDVWVSTLRQLPVELADAALRLRDELDPEERTMLLLYAVGSLSWKEVVESMVDSDEPAVTKREEARLRKRFERAKEKLTEMAQARGLRAALDDTRAVLEDVRRRGHEG